MFMSFPIAIPPMKEQLAIVDWLSRVEDQFYSLTKEAQSTITLLQERRAALISAAVTGQIDVHGLVQQKAEEELEVA